MSKPAKPADVKAWWRAGCCGPRTADPAGQACGFCGESVLDCAAACSEAVNAGLVVTGDGDVEDRADVCGGSGFWCRGCGRFWAQDSCGNYEQEEHLAADGAALAVRDGRVTCVCDRPLMNFVYEPGTP